MEAANRLVWLSLANALSTLTPQSTKRSQACLSDVALHGAINHLQLF